MRKKEKTFTDKKRQMMMGRFHDYILPSGVAVTRDLISVEMLAWKSEGNRKDIETNENNIDTNQTVDLLSKKIETYRLNDRNAVEAMMVLDARMNLSDDLLLYTDKISMQSSLETRVPFLDIELMAFAESLPSHFKTGLFKSKWLHKKLAEKHLPNEIIYRKKRGFYAPTKSWFEGSTGEVFASHRRVESWPNSLQAMLWFC